MLTAGSMSTSPAIDFDFAASSGKRTAYETIKISRGFFNVSCIFVDTYSAAKETSYHYVSGAINVYPGIAYVIAKVFSRKEQMKSVVQVLPSGDSFSRAGRDMSVNPWCQTSLTTHKPILEPTDSINPQACCRCFSSWFMESFPLCLSDIRSASSGVKYGKWYLT